MFPSKENWGPSQVRPLGTVQQEIFCLYHSSPCARSWGKGSLHSEPLVLLREKVGTHASRRGRLGASAFMWPAVFLGRGKCRDPSESRS